MPRPFAALGAAAFLLLPSLPAAALSVRTLDGTGNNLTHGDWGATDTRLVRMAPAAYEDGASDPRGGDPSWLPSARAVSNAVAAQTGSRPNARGVTDWFWQWGQLIDHDLDLTEPGHPSEAFDVLVPTGDPHFDPSATGAATIGLERSVYDPSTGTGVGNPREQINQITAWLDGSMVYGSDATRAAALRTFSEGRLATSTGANGETLLPYNVAGLPNAGGASASLFLAGDVRANEQLGLTAAHTLFVREHNRLADDLAARLDAGEAGPTDAFLDSGLDRDEFLYQAARKVVGAEIQVITYDEWLPLLLGPGALAPYGGHDAGVNPGIANEFSTAAFRVGHTMLSPQLLRLHADGSDAGALALRDAFFAPGIASLEGVDSLLFGLASQGAQEIDAHVVDDVRNFLFGPPGAGGFDLASLNLQRGREHGLPGLNEVRDVLGLALHGSFLEMTGGDAELATAFASVYDDVDHVDLWIGGLAEAHQGDGLVGETFAAILADQFARLRDGDRFFHLADEELALLLMLDPGLLDTRLADVIRRNSSIHGVQDAAFLLAVPEPGALALLAGALLAPVLHRRRAERRDRA